MNTGFIAPAVKAKGILATMKRMRRIVGQYGVTPAKMESALQLFAQILAQFECEASFAITAIVLKRNRRVIANYMARNIEFIVHGYTHIDYSQLGSQEQLSHLRRARQIFAEAGIEATGFRSPYLRREAGLHAAITEAGFSYTSNQPILWDILDPAALNLPSFPVYERAVAFYNPWLAKERLSLPQLQGTLIDIPVSLPDDEMLIDRLDSAADGLVERAWCAILTKTYSRGELFTIQLHPERIAQGAQALVAVLSKARALTPPVWIARLGEIAAWWRQRADAAVTVTKADGGAWRLTVAGPARTTILARGVDIVGPSQPWLDGYQQVNGSTCLFRASCRPFIGASPDCPQARLEFLRQQGYVVEVSREAHLYAIYFDRADFSQGEYSLMEQIQHSGKPLIRLGCWPNGARSAIAISGDIDAMTLWDYGLRVLGQ